MAAAPPLPRRPGTVPDMTSSAPPLSAAAPPGLPARPSHQPPPAGAAAPPMPPRPGAGPPPSSHPTSATPGPSLPPRPVVTTAHVPAPFSYARSHAPHVISPRADPAQAPVIPERPAGYTPTQSRQTPPARPATPVLPPTGNAPPRQHSSEQYQYQATYVSGSAYSTTTSASAFAPGSASASAPSIPSNCSYVQQAAYAESAHSTGYTATSGPVPSSTSYAAQPRQEDDGSITELLKETSKDYVKTLTQGVSQVLSPQNDKREPTEDEKRAAREREKEFERKENEYITQQKHRVLEEEERRRKAAEYGSSPSSTAPQQSTPAASMSGHQITLNLTGNVRKEYMGKAYAVYIIYVNWNGVSWTVYRRYKQFSDFNSQSKKASCTFSYALPPKKMQGNLKDEFVEHRQRELQKYLIAVSDRAPSMMSNKKARIALLRFFAPTQVGDKGPSTSLPFDLSELV